MGEAFLVGGTCRRNSSMYYARVITPVSIPPWSPLLRGAGPPGEPQVGPAVLDLHAASFLTPATHRAHFSSSANASSLDDASRDK